MDGGPYPRAQNMEEGMSLRRSLTILTLLCIGALVLTLSDATAAKADEALETAAKKSNNPVSDAWLLIVRIETLLKETS